MAETYPRAGAPPPPPPPPPLPPQAGEPAWSTPACASTLRAKTGRCAAIIGGGLSGLATAAAFASRGFGVLIIDASGEPGRAPASSAAAGLLDPLTPKGKLMWQGLQAFDSARKLLDAAAAIEQQHSTLPPLYRVAGTVHVPRGRKDAAALREAAMQHTASEECNRLGIAFVDSAAPHGIASSATAVPAEVASLARSGACPDGALYCGCGLLVDVPRYLCQLWKHVLVTAPAAMWSCQRSPDSLRLAAAFDCVVLAAGAGCLMIDETRHLPIDLCRGQVLEYALGAMVGTDPASAAACPLPPPPSETLASLLSLTVGLTGAVYLLPMASADNCASSGTYGRRWLGGGTHEPCTDAEQRSPADLAHATEALHPGLVGLFPPLAAAGSPVCVRAGVRAMPPRSPEGSVPLAGRAHTNLPNVWFVSGMGARGLLYHALIGEWVAEAAAMIDPSRLPAVLRRGEFAAVLAQRLVKLAATRAAEDARPIQRSSESTRVACPDFKLSVSSTL